MQLSHVGPEARKGQGARSALGRWGWILCSSHGEAVQFAGVAQAHTVPWAVPGQQAAAKDCARMSSHPCADGSAVLGPPPSSW